MPPRSACAIRPAGRREIVRRRAGLGFYYRGPTGEGVRNPEVLGRIRSLAIPSGVERRPDLPPRARAFTGWRTGCARPIAVPNPS
ncbi:MAG: hypothetical protein WD696_03160 [Bryobacteraceae bacterium]